MAIIPPTPFGTAFCIASPLAFKIFKVSENLIYPAQDNAEYSPKEWPAKKLALFKLISNSFFITLKIEKLIKKIAGCVLKVKSKSDFGPSSISLDNRKFKVSSASLK